MEVPRFSQIVRAPLVLLVGAVFLLSQRFVISGALTGATKE